MPHHQAKTLSTNLKQNKKNDIKRSKNNFPNFYNM